MDTDDVRTAAGGEAEEDRLHQDADRVRVDAIRDADGRHPVQEVHFSFVVNHSNEVTACMSSWSYLPSTSNYLGCVCAILIIKMGLFD